MKRISIVAALALLAVGCSGGDEATTQVEVNNVDENVATVAFNADSLPTVAFSVPSMMCEDSCVPAVRQILADQPGVKDVQVVLDAKTATVAVDEAEFDADKAIAALLDMQFENTTLITADASSDDSIDANHVSGDATVPDADAADDEQG